MLAGQRRGPETKGGSCPVQLSVSLCKTSENSVEGKSAVGFRAFFFFLFDVRWVFFPGFVL